jgi:serine/threonine-protein kinase
MLEPEHVASGHVIDGKYELVSLVAQGEHGELWRGELHGADEFVRPVAVKVVPASRLGDRAGIERFLTHVRRSTALDHPNIVQVQDLALDPGAHYHVVSEWVDGVSMRELSGGLEQLVMPMPWPIAVAIGVGVLRGLSWAHQQVDLDGESDPVRHGAVTPDRMLVGVNGIAKIGGFAMLGATRKELTASDVCLYQAPEVGLRVPWNETADVFGVGAVLWEALAGVSPFEGDMDRVVAFHAGEITLPSLAKMRSGLPSRLVTVLDRALAYCPDDRFASADAMAAELASLLGGVDWRRGSQNDLGDAVREVRVALGRAPRSTPSEAIREVTNSDIIRVVPEGEPEHPILLTRLAATPLTDEDLVAVSDES